MSQSEIAHKVLTECLQVKENKQVLINSFHHTLGMANALAFEAYKLGAQPLVLVNTDELMENYLTKVPEKYYSNPRRAFLSLLDQTDAIVELGGPEDPAMFQRIPANRLSSGFDYGKSILEKQQERGIPDIFLPTGMLTPQRAKTYGFNLDHWQKMTNNAIDVDHAKISALGKKLASKLQHTSKVHLTARNGTDLTFAVGERPVHVHDGILDEGDVSGGNIFETLPSGSVEFAPIESSAEGSVLFDQPMALRGKMLKGLRLDFQRGKLVSYEAQGNKDAFADYYEGSSGDKDRIANFGIGLNPKAEFIGYFTDTLVLGAVHVGIGGNKGIGGANDTPFGHTQTLSRATVEADGQKILVEGKLNI